jgi:uncharacterized protein YutE (UPF0331/DUF86 family)
MLNLGIIAQEDHDILHDAIELRNAVIHGYKTAQADSGVVVDMLAIVEGLLTLKEY